MAGSRLSHAASVAERKNELQLNRQHSGCTRAFWLCFGFCLSLGLSSLFCGLDLGLGWGRPAIAWAANSGYELELAIDLRSSDLTLSTPATVTMQLAAEELDAGSCLYFSLLDPLALRIQNLLALGGHSVREQAARQEAAVQDLSSPYLEALSPSLYRVKTKPPAGRLALSYGWQLPGWKDRQSDTRLLTAFYPQLLPRCPAAGEEPMFAPEGPKNFRVQIRHPADWSVLAQGQAKQQTWTYSGRQFSAVLYRRGQVKESQVGSGRLFILSASASFQELEHPAAKAMQLFTELSGMPPEKDLIVVETDDFEPFNVPGLIALNRPQQKFMKMLQEEYLHWNVWQLGRALAEQWFGLGIKAASLDDYWLVQGFADDLLLQYVESERLLGNLFIGKRGEEAYLQLRFRQAQDLQAAILSMNDPSNALVDAGGRSRPLSGLSSRFNFIRHSLALRYLRWYLHEPAYSDWLKRLTRSFQAESLSPEAVLETLEPVRAGAAKGLLAFWQNDSWPDLAVGSVGPNPDGPGTKIEIQQLSPLRVAFDVSIKTRLGVRYTQELSGPGDTLSFVVEQDPADIVDIEIDPHRILYDMDRYNNTDRWTQFTLFPGGARTLRDDAYTVLWVPLASKLPGQSLSLQLSWQVLRYVGSSLSGGLYYYPEDGSFGIKAAYRKNLPDLAMNLNFSVNENAGGSVPGERTWDLRLQRAPLFNGLESWVLDASLRARQKMGRPADNHLSSALGLSYKADKLAACGHDLETDVEMSTWVPRGDFEYTRSSGIFRAGCEVPGFELKLRGFLGVLKSRGEVPGGVLFSPQDLSEARVRLDKPKLAATARARTFNLDVAVPARLPLPESGFVLPRRSVFRVFSDWGEFEQARSSVHVAGIGYGLPFGGDVVGKSSITFLQFALYSVLYRRIDQAVDSKPGFLFDLSGDL